MAITVTQAAASRIQNSIHSRGRGVGLRIALKTAGCSGYMYDLDYVDEIGENDVVFEDQGVKIVVDKENLGLLDGTEVDFGREGINEAFKFNNPNATAECGCGESFST
ncbi:MAG: iron-sulfur cluster assembly accessory protein [Gammaproteobacteria bacterium]|nr:MAG: iron-sulfur cluster assembly accessory protein [Gammaproteobacteria bacterium]